MMMTMIDNNHNHNHHKDNKENYQQSLSLSSSETNNIHNIPHTKHETFDPTIGSIHSNITIYEVETDQQTLPISTTSTTNSNNINSNNAVVASTSTTEESSSLSKSQSAVYSHDWLLSIEQKILALSAKSATTTTISAPNSALNSAQRQSSSRHRLHSPAGFALSGTEGFSKNNSNTTNNDADIKRLNLFTSKTKK
jgi:hypothetical protein